MKMKLAALVLLAGTLVMAQDKPPIISAEHRGDLFKAQLALLQAQAAEQAAKTKMDAIIAELTKDCGDKYQPQMDPQSGDPVCVAKPEPAK